MVTAKISIKKVTFLSISDNRRDLSFFVVFICYGRKNDCLYF